MLRRGGRYLSWQRSLGVRATPPRRRQPSSSRGLVRLAAVIPLMVMAFGCSVSGGNLDSDTNVILVLDSLAAVSDPFGDVVTTGGTILDDTVTATFSAHLKAPITTSAQTTKPELQEVILER